MNTNTDAKTAITRRGFLKGLAGLATVAVIPTTLVPLRADDRERFIADAMRNRSVIGATFLFDGPVVLDVTGMGDFLISRCRFVWESQQPMWPAAITITRSDECMVRIINSEFSGSGTLLKFDDASRARALGA